MNEDVLKAIQDAIAMLRSPGYFDYHDKEDTASKLHRFLQEELTENHSNNIQQCNYCKAKAIINKDGITQCGMCRSRDTSCCCA
ncbi:MAG: hypothetical protein WC435_00710 [Candidatus Paceibacterota bacterium]